MLFPKFHFLKKILSSLAATVIFMYSKNKNHSTSLYSSQVTLLLYERKDCQNTYCSGWFKISQGYFCSVSHTDIPQVKQYLFCIANFLVSWCFWSSQPLGIISGLIKFLGILTGHIKLRQTGTLIGDSVIDSIYIKISDNIKNNPGLSSYL